MSRKTTTKLLLPKLLIGLAGLLALAAVLVVALNISRIFHPSSSMAPKVEVMPPCGSAVNVASLGSPFPDGPVASFTTDGSDIFITARRFEHGGYFDPEVGQTLVYVGDADKLPSYDSQQSTISNQRVNLQVIENKYTKVELPIGRYWLWSTNGAGIEVASCGSISGEKPSDTRQE